MRIFFQLIFAFVLLHKVLYAQNGPSKQWDKTFGGSNWDDIKASQHTADGGYILGGSSNSNSSPDKSQPSKGLYDFWVIKLDANGTKVWDKTIGGNDWDQLNSLQQTSDGGYILGGESKSGISGDKTQAPYGPFLTYDFWLVKLDAAGNKRWDKTIGGDKWDVIQSVQQTTDGGYILGGSSVSGIGFNKTEANLGDWDYWVVRVDSVGNILWDKTLGGTSADALFSIKQTADGGFILGGYSGSGVSATKSQPNKGGWDFWVVKLDAAGNKLWDKTLGGSGAEAIQSVEQTSDGGYILTGWSGSGIGPDKSEPNKGLGDGWVVKLDSNGNKLWDKTFGGSQFERFQSGKQTADKGYIFGGFSYSSISGDKTQVSRGGEDFWIVKTDSLGNKLWDKTFGGPDQDYLYALDQHTDGSYLFSGMSRSGIGGDKSQAGRGDWDFWAVKLYAPCSGLTASFVPVCSNGNTNITVKIEGLENVPVQNPSWTLTYAINGVSQVVSATSETHTLAQNVPVGTTFTLISLVSDRCTVVLTNSIIVQPVPGAPAGVSTSSCGPDSVTLVASGAPAGGAYLWYNAATGGTALYTSATGTFITPILNTTTTFYVAAANNAGCEGLRTPVTATINILPLVNAGLNELICSNAAPVQLAGFSPAGGTWSGPGVNATGLFTPSSSLTGPQTLTYTITQNGCAVSATKQITIPVAIPQPTITFIAPDTLVASIAGSTYEWQLNGTLLATTSRKLKATAAGAYAVRVRDANSCASAFSADYNFIVSSIKEQIAVYFELFPNPSTGLVFLNFGDLQPVKVTVTNVLGQEIVRKMLSKTDAKVQLILDLSKASKGIYFVHVETEKQHFVKRLVLE